MNSFLKAFLVILASIGPAAAEPLPQQVHNKTISFDWNEDLAAKLVSDGSVFSGISHYAVKFAIDGEGRVRYTTQITSDEKNVAKFGPTEVTGELNFAGTSMTWARNSEDMARQWTFSFDPSFSSCSAALIIGKSKAHPRFKNTKGQELEFISNSVGPVTCSIQDGNAAQ